MIALPKPIRWPRFGAAHRATTLIGVDLGADTIRAVQLLRTTDPRGTGPGYQIRSHVLTRRSAEQDAPSGGAIPMRRLVLTAVFALSYSSPRGER